MFPLIASPTKDLISRNAHFTKWG